MAIPQAHNIAIVEAIQPLPIQDIPGLIRKETHTGEDVMKIVAERYQDVLKHEDLWHVLYTYPSRSDSYRLRVQLPLPHSQPRGVYALAPELQALPGERWTVGR